MHPKTDYAPMCVDGRNASKDPLLKFRGDSVLQLV